MKRVHTIAAVALLAGLAAAFSCKKDPAPAPSTDPSIYWKADDAGVLRSSLVFTDSDNQITGYVTGYAFNAADPGEVSVLCESLEAARELFQSWAPDGTTFKEEGSTLVWDMTDSLGISQGAAILMPGGNPGAVAHLQVPTDFPAISSVQFLPKSAMPENAELDFADALDQYFFGNVINVYSSDFKDNKAPHGTGVFCIIREYDQDSNTSGILLSLPEYEHKVNHIYYTEWDEKVQKYLNQGRKLSELQGNIGKTYRQYRKYIDMALKPYHQVSGDHWFAAKLDDSKKTARYNLVTNETASYWVKDVFGWCWAPDFYDCRAYYFTLEKDGKGGYKVIYK